MHDGSAQLQRLAARRFAVMLAIGWYKRSPLLMHLNHAVIGAASMFAQWLGMWRETIDELLPATTASAMQAKDQRIAESFHFNNGEPIRRTPSRPGLVSDEQPHHFGLLGAMRMQGEFYNKSPS